jgi:hypothetical protein
MCFLRSGEKMNFPGRIVIPELPLIDWSKYGRHTADTIQRRLASKRRKAPPLPATDASGGSFDKVTSGEDGSLSASGGGSCGGKEEVSGQQLVRGRLYSESKPQVSECAFPVIFFIICYTRNTRLRGPVECRLDIFWLHFILKNFKVIPIYGT